MEKTLILSEFAGFQWDNGNSDKNWIRHGVTTLECEQVFFNKPFILLEDSLHSIVEPRYYVLGQTDEGRKLYIVFTPRRKLIRVISARPMSKKEREFYAKI